MLESRELLLNDLQRYQDFWEEQSSSQFPKFLSFVHSTENCCERTHLEGHCTGSAFVVSPDHSQVLLLFHPFLERWLQPGGHADGSFDLLDVAKRETHEESGLPLEHLTAVPLGGNARVPFDLDIHPIPRRKSEPAHFHYDLRFLLYADPQAPLHPESPKMELRWLPIADLESLTEEESVLRMGRQLQAL